MVALIREAQVFRPALRAAFVINRRVSTTIIGREARQSLAEQPLPALRAEVHQRIVFRSEEHTSELQSLMRISYAVFCLKKKKNKTQNRTNVRINSLRTTTRDDVTQPKLNKHT